MQEPKQEKNQEQKQEEKAEVGAEIEAGSGVGIQEEEDVFRSKIRIRSMRKNQEQDQTLVFKRMKL